MRLGETSKVLVNDATVKIHLRSLKYAAHIQQSIGVYISKNYKLITGNFPQRSDCPL